MKHISKKFLCGLYIVSLLIIILDFKTAAQGASDAIELCIRTVIPSLFPFMVLSILLNSYLTGSAIRILKPIARICSIPEGCETILLLGLLGGYPVGAQSIYHAWRQKQISTSQARRMLGFCNNAGPAYIFGMAVILFEKPVMIWAAWAIHIISAITTGIILPHSPDRSNVVPKSTEISFSCALERTIKTLSVVCGWIVLFRVMIIYLQKWFYRIFSDFTLTIMCGFLELTNGCIELYALHSQGLRFILFSTFLALGGICVAAQTISVTKGLGTGLYFPGKIMQCSISTVLASITQCICLGQQRYIPSNALIGLCLITAIVIRALLDKKTVAFLKSVVYNIEKYTRKGHAHAISKKAS